MAMNNDITIEQMAFLSREGFKSLVARIVRLHTIENGQRYCKERGNAQR